MTEGGGVELSPKPLVLEVSLFSENTTTHLENGFKAFTAALGVLGESFHARLLNLILDLLPSTTKSGDLGFLVELGR